MSLLITVHTVTFHIVDKGNTQYIKSIIIYNKLVILLNERFFPPATPLP